MVRAVPAEGVRLHNVRQPGLVGEEERQVRCQYAVLHVPQNLLVLFWTELVKYVVVFLGGEMADQTKPSSLSEGERGFQTC